MKIFYTTLSLCLSLVFVSAALADENHFSDPLRYQPFLGKFKASACPEFKKGALVDVRYSDGIMTRYEIPDKWVEGFVIVSDFYPYPGYDGTPIRHQRTYRIHGWQRTSGFYKTFFTIDADKIFFKITEELEAGKKPIVRSHMEIMKKNYDQLLFTNRRNSARGCLLTAITQNEYESELLRIGKATSGDYQ